MRRCEHHTSHRVGSGSRQQLEQGRVGRFSIARFPACNFPGRWRIHQRRRAIAAKTKPRCKSTPADTQGTRLFHVCGLFSCRWHNCKPSRWRCATGRLFGPCSRRIEQQTVQRLYWIWQKDIYQITQNTSRHSPRKGSEGTTRNEVLFTQSATKSK